MSYAVVQAGELAWEERPPAGDSAPRFAADLTTALELAESRARMWRFPPGARGRRHVEGAQEELFVVLEGTLTILLGDTPDRVQVGPGGVAAVKPGCPLQLRNEGDTELRLFIYGAPPVTGEGQLLDELEPGV